MSGKTVIHTEIEFLATDSRGSVSGVLDRPHNSWCLYVLAHGAGAGMNHHFFATFVPNLWNRGVATFRYRFPYMEGGNRRPDPAPILEATVRSAVVAAAGAAPNLPLFAGGKSMGGRMTSRATSTTPLPGVRGLIFLGFPLHPAGKAATERADHLQGVDLPMLFLQGTRDRLADLDLLRPVVQRIGGGARLHIVEGGDHSFEVPKRSGRSEEDVLEELAEAVAAWGREVLRA